MLLVVVLAALVRGAAGDVYTGMAAFAKQCHDLTNQERVNMGLAPLYGVSELITAALLHAQDMQANNYFSHSSLDGRSPFDRMQAADYSFQTAAENIARGQSTPAAVVLAWMNSPGALPPPPRRFCCCCFFFQCGFHF